MNRRIVCTVSNDLTCDQRMIRICSALAEQGYDVVLTGRFLPDSAPVEPGMYRQLRWKCLFRKGPLFYLELNLRIAWYLLKTPCRAVYSVDLDTVSGAALARLFRKWVWIYDAHEYFTEVPELVNRQLVRRIWLKVEAMILRRADLILTVSESIGDIFRQKTKSQVLVIRNVPILRSKLAKPIKPETFTLIYQGALNEGRCVEHYIRAVQGLPVQLSIAGEGDLSDELRKLSQELGMDSQVEFLGRLKPAELWKQTQKAHLGLNVLEHRGQSYYYSLSNKCFDYIQAGIPQLCSDFPEYRGIHDQWGCLILIKPEVSDIREKIVWLMQNSEELENLSAKAELAGRELVWENEKRKLQNLYERIA